MKKLKFSKTAAITAVSVIMGFAGTGVAITNAATLPADGHGANNLVSAIAKRFNLQETEVQQVFNDQRTQMKAAHEQKAQDRLNQAVAAGKLTQDQANAIKAKATEMKTIMEGLKDKTKEERAATMKAEMDSLKKWVTDNNIPKQFAPIGDPRMKHG